jgi:dihydroorotate dehydrogenase electron transfer subunit
VTPAAAHATPVAFTWRQVVARVRAQRTAGADHRWLELALPREVPAPVPGQFVQLLAGADASPTLLPRPMSVAAAGRQGGALVLGFLYAPIGIGTRALAALAPGASVTVLGPLGRGFPLERPGRPVLVAGGRGVAPLLFAADALARAGRASTFLFGARSRDLLVELASARQRLRKAGGRLEVCTDDGSAGVRGNVVTLLDRLDPAVPVVIHACGPHAMLGAVARWAMARRVPAHLAMESMMACGTGVCRGCPLPRSERGRRAFGDRAPSLLGNRDFAMCCTEGPVFEANDLDWDRIE